MNKTKQKKDYILHETRDRRLFPHVPDPGGKRSNISRRDDHLEEKRPAYAEYAGVRYESEVDVTINTGAKRMRATSLNISQTGMLLRLAEGFAVEDLDKDQKVKLDFRLEEGDLQEGTEKHYRNISAKVVRLSPDKTTVAVQFNRLILCKHAHDVNAAVGTVA